MEITYEGMTWEEAKRATANAIALEWATIALITYVFDIPRPLAQELYHEKLTFEQIAQKLETISWNGSCGGGCDVCSSR